MAPRMRILLVDDDPLILDSIAEVLSFDGHDVVVAANGQAGLACFVAAQESDVPFDAVVTDLGMPVLNGIQVANEIRARMGTHEYAVDPDGYRVAQRRVYKRRGYEVAPAMVDSINPTPRNPYND